MVPSSSCCIINTAGTILGVSALFYWYHLRTIRHRSIEWEEKRLAERKGRIRAEVRLRTALKQQTALKHDSDSHAMTLKCIGTVTSPYTKRMGTPRQGALVPSSRGFVLFSKKNIHMEALSGIEDYSHVWIIFGFHANTDLPSSGKAKVKPPRGGGIKVGQLATRSPHRPNAIGLSLVRVDRLDKEQGRLYISAIDLVQGTPVYDIKPCVPWDIPGHHDGVALSVPDWVDQDDALSQVEFTAKASDSLRCLVSENRLKPLYTDDNDGFAAACRTLTEVLAQDPRASTKRGAVTKTEESSYRLVFGATQVEFVVQASGVVVLDVRAVDFNETSYVDGIPLIAAEN